jgi:hypothetical protein
MSKLALVKMARLPQPDCGANRVAQGDEGFSNWVANFLKCSVSPKNEQKGVAANKINEGKFYFVSQ